MEDPFQAMMKGFAAGNPFAQQGGGMNQMMQMMQMQMQMAQQQPQQQTQKVEEVKEVKEEKKEEKKPEVKEEKKDDSKSLVDLKLESVDAANKINLIKELRKLDSSLGIKQAKELVDGAPIIFKKQIAKEEAEKLKKALEGLGKFVIV